MELLRQSKKYLRVLFESRARIMECTKEEEAAAAAGCLDFCGFE
jgi:hypothetical protein